MSPWIKTLQAFSKTELKHKASGTVKMKDYHSTARRKNDSPKISGSYSDSEDSSLRAGKMQDTRKTIRSCRNINFTRGVSIGSESILLILLLLPLSGKLLEYIRYIYIYIYINLINLLFGYINILRNVCFIVFKLAHLQLPALSLDLYPHWITWP